MLKWLTHWWKFTLYATIIITATAAADTMIPDPFLSRLAALAIPTFGGPKMVLDLFDRKGMQRQIDERDQEIRQKDRQLQEKDQENQELRRRIQELERNGNASSPGP